MLGTLGVTQFNHCFSHFDGAKLLIFLDMTKKNMFYNMFFATLGVF